jgi:hypothetical protein
LVIKEMRILEYAASKTVSHTKERQQTMREKTDFGVTSVPERKYTEKPT